MAVKRWTRERRRELTRRTLLDAAAETFAQQGFSGASLDKIAQVAGYTRDAITFNFGTKEELLLAVIERQYQSPRRLRPAHHGAAQWRRSCHAR